MSIHLITTHARVLDLGESSEASYESIAMGQHVEELYLRIRREELPEGVSLCV